MFKAFYSALLSFSVLNAAHHHPERIDDLEYPTIVPERAGFYKFTLSGLRAAIVLDALTNIPPSTPYDSATAEEFRKLLLHFVYPHPSKVSGINSTGGFRETIIDLRSALGISQEGLPFFPMSQYEKLLTYHDALAALKTHIESSIAKATLTLDAEVITLLVSNHLDQPQAKTKKLLDGYAAFYNPRPTPFRKHDIERYIIGLIRLTSNEPPSSQSLAILKVLQDKGCLELSGSLVDSKFTYSPKEMAREYIAHKGAPSTIILGGGHADSREMLEALRLPTKTCCGACQKMPHADAMVVSLDETWSLSCCTPETLENTARVLIKGGEFHSNKHIDDCTTIEALIARGFEIVEKNLDTRTIKLRKIR